MAHGPKAIAAVYAAHFFVMACAVLTVLLSTGGRLQAAEKIQRFALLIGVDDYNELDDLHCAGSDQRAFATRLTAGGFPEDQVWLLEDKANENRYRPFGENIRRQMKLVLSLAKRDDLLIVGFSGHGVTLGGKRYLCPADARLEEPTTLLAVDDLYEQLADCPAKLKLVFLDACRAGDPRPPGRRAAATLPGLATFNTGAKRLPSGLMILSSCGENQIAMEDQEKLGHGVFMHFVLEGLGGKAANDDGVVTLPLLYDYASRNTEKYVARRWNDLQTPALDGKLDGNFELARLEPPGVLPVNPTPSRPAQTPPVASPVVTSSRPTPPPQPPNQAPPKPGEVITNSIGMKLVSIPAGSFKMGAPESEKDRSNDDGPVHRVRITQPFYLGVYEVTQEEYQAITGTNPSSFSSTGDRKNNVKGLDTRRSPVETVSWNEAVEFCSKLSQREGKRYRLPTEAEWEYCCRAGTISPFSFGASLNGTAANCDGNQPYGTSSKGPYLERTTSVGRYSPNAFGLYDMHGNVWEWCADWYDKDYYGRSPAEDPRGPAAGASRVLRGGGWIDNAACCLSANRFDYEPSHHLRHTGFRVACEP